MGAILDGPSRGRVAWQRGGTRRWGARPMLGGARSLDSAPHACAHGSSLSSEAMLGGPEAHRGRDALERVRCRSLGARGIRTPAGRLSTLSRTSGCCGMWRPKRACLAHFVSSRVYSVLSARTTDLRCTLPRWKRCMKLICLATRRPFRRVGPRGSTLARLSWTTHGGMPPRFAKQRSRPILAPWIAWIKGLACLRSLVCVCVCSFGGRI